MDYDVIMEEAKDTVSLVTRAKNGNVSIIRDLTREVAEKLAQKLNVYNKSRSDGFFHIYDGDIVETHII